MRDDSFVSPERYVCRACGEEADLAFGATACVNCGTHGAGWDKVASKRQDMPDAVERTRREIALSSAMSAGDQSDQPKRHSIRADRPTDAQWLARNIVEQTDPPFLALVGEQDVLTLARALLSLEEQFDALGLAVTRQLTPLDVAATHIDILRQKGDEYSVQERDNVAAIVESHVKEARAALFASASSPAIRPVCPECGYLTPGHHPKCPVSSQESRSE